MGKKNSRQKDPSADDQAQLPERRTWGILFFGAWEGRAAWAGDGGVSEGKVKGEGGAGRGQGRKKKVGERKGG